MIRIANKRLGGEGDYVGRPSPLGNPFKPKDRWSVGETLPKYEEWLRKAYWTDVEVYTEMNLLKRKARHEDVTLVCWCHPGPCHAQIIKKLLEEMLDE